MQFARKTEPLLREMLSESPVVWIRGARQVGKSTLALAAARVGRTYLSLDDYAVLAAARADPQAFVLGLSADVILDEVQRAPGLFRAVMLAVDRDRRPGRFLLTGSANVFTLPHANESLAGRMQILDLAPLAQAEIEGSTGNFLDALRSGVWPALHLEPDDLALPALWKRLCTGGFPEAVLARSEPARGRLLSAYLQTLIERDLRDISDISRLQKVPQLLEALYGRASTLLNRADLSRALGLPASTLERYLSLIEAVFLYQPLRAFHADTATALAKAPKVDILDTGLAAHLLNLGGEDFNNRSFGPLLESFVSGELRRLATWSASPVRFSHFRTKHGAEVDLVLEIGTSVIGVEVKASRKLTTGDFAGLAKLQEVAGERWARGIILYGGEAVIPFGNYWAIPMAALWRW